MTNPDQGSTDHNHQPDAYKLASEGRQIGHSLIAHETVGTLPGWSPYAGAAKPEVIDLTATEAAAVRKPVNTDFDPAREAARQAGIAAADRRNREAAGLEPRVHDLR